jgi:L-rhamnose isomerase
MATDKSVESAFMMAEEQYAALGVQVSEALEKLSKISISLHCWQTDDVGGFEKPDAALGGGGIQVTGNYPGKARSIDEMRSDLEMVYSLLPGAHRLNLHASYGEFGGTYVDRDAIEPAHFKGWVDWAQRNSVKLDFNSTFFSHPKADDGFTLSSKDESIRQFWIEHGKRCREISAFMGTSQGSTCIHNIWIPDGMKDTPIDRYGHRALLCKSLDEILQKSNDPTVMKDAVEAKLFGIGSESFVVGSHEFYLAYAVKNNTMICIDAGHFHPTEVVGDKISAILQFVPEMMLHMTRGVRWDSDHVVTLNDDSLLICQEIVRSGALDRVNIGLDFFDASINRIGAYVTGTQAVLKGLLIALLEPVDLLRDYEENGQWFERLAVLEALKAMPWGAVWDYYCFTNGVPHGMHYMGKVQDYEKEVLSKRGR